MKKINGFGIHENGAVGRKTMDRLKEIFGEKLRERDCVWAEGGYTLEFRIDPELGDCYSLIPGKNTVLLSGGRESNLFAALGRFMTESEFDGRGGFIPRTVLCTMLTKYSFAVFTLPLIFIIIIMKRRLTKYMLLLLIWRCAAVIRFSSGLICIIILGFTLRKQRK